MAEFLVIRLAHDPAKPVTWITVDNRGTRRGNIGQGSLQDAAREIRDNDVIVLVPSTDVLTLTADIPAKGARLQAALPYALEDQVAEDIELLHFAAGRRMANGQLPVAVVRHEKMTQWLEMLQSAGIDAARLIPENHGLPRTPNTLSMLVTDNLVMFNDGDSTEFAIPDIGPAEAIAAAGVLDGSDESASRHLLVYCDAALGDRHEKDWALLRHELSSVDVNLLPDGALPRLAVTAASGAGINMLQGTYGARTELGGLFRPWRHAAMLLVGLFVVALLGKGVDTYRLSTELQSLQTQFAETYATIRPGDTRDIVDPTGIVRSLARSQSPTATGPQVFLPSLQQLAEALAPHSSIKVEAISYRAGVVDVRLTAPDIPTLDQIVQSVGSSGRFVASMQSADRVGEQVNSRIQIREAGA